MLPVVAFMFVMQIVQALEFLYWHPERISELYLLQMTIAGRHVDVRMVPFFYARVWSVFLWSCRLLWRIMTRQSEDDRVMLQGEVEFHFHWRKRLQSRVALPVPAPPLAAIGSHAP